MEAQRSAFPSKASVHTTLHNLHVIEGSHKIYNQIKKYAAVHRSAKIQKQNTKLRLDNYTTLMDYKPRSTQYICTMHCIMKANQHNYLTCNLTYNNKLKYTQHKILDSQVMD